MNGNLDHHEITPQDFKTCSRREFFIGALQWLMLLCVACGSVAHAAQPYPNRSGQTNWVLNPSVNSGTGWNLSGGAVLDQHVSHTKDATGAFDLTAPGAEIDSDWIPVQPGTTYTLSAYMRTTSWPTHAAILVGVLDSSGRNILNSAGDVLNVSMDYQATTGPNVWQEIQTQYTARPGDGYIIYRVVRLGADKSPHVDGNMWVDDFFVGSGTMFSEPASPKTVFDGTAVKVDALGNFTVANHGVMMPYFPFCVYNTFDDTADATRARIQKYSNQGFNCIMYNEFSETALQWAKSATSTFNPGGMMSMIDINQYIAQQKPDAPPDMNELNAKSSALARSSLFGNVLGYYWDNEQWNQYTNALQATSIVRLNDANRGRRQHPIIMLQGNQAMTRAYRTMVDVAMDYLRDGFAAPTRRELTTAQRFSILGNLQGQTIPTGLGVISEEATAAGLRRQVYQALIAGVKGIAYFKDGGCYENYNGADGPNGVGCADMSQREAWAEFPKLRQEIDKLMPVIRQPLSTNWAVGLKSSPGPSPIQVGKRDVSGVPVLILLNTSSNSVSSLATFAALAGKPAAVYDYFTGKKIASVNRTPAQLYQFSFALGPNQTAVYKLM